MVNLADLCQLLSARYNSISYRIHRIVVNLKSFETTNLFMNLLQIFFLCFYKHTVANVLSLNALSGIYFKILLKISVSISGNNVVFI